MVGRVTLLAKGDPRVVYMGPDRGPFLCGRCIHFGAPNRCERVAGDIQAHACCNLFQPVNEGGR